MPKNHHGRLSFNYYQRLTHCACCVFGSGALLLPLAHVLWEPAGAWLQKEGLEVHVQNHVTRLTLANRIQSSAHPGNPQTGACSRNSDGELPLSGNPNPRQPRLLTIASINPSRCE